ncbi:Uncharacterised protein [Segatella copri]|nr:Uncharacterised protein [Segatella copri]
MIVEIVRYINKQRTVSIQGIDLETLFHRFRYKSVDVLECGRINLQTIFYVRTPLASQNILAVAQRLKLHRRPIP